MWDGSLTLAVWCRNLLDETYFSGGISFANLYGNTSRFTAPPRTYGGELTFRF
jgi:iron complex outermembrane receptor protein